MAYNNFTLDSVKHQFDLNLIDSPFCDGLPIAEPQPESLTIIGQWLFLADGVTTPLQPRQDAASAKLG